MSDDEIIDSTGRVWRLTRDFGETDVEYAARLEMLRGAVETHMTLDERIQRYDNVVRFPERLETFSMDDVYPKDIKAKWSMMRITSLRLENAGISEPDFVEHMKAHLGSEAPDVERWLHGMVRDVSLDTLAVVFDAAADLTTRTTLAMVIDDANT